MIKENVLDGVDEVYGLHNASMYNEGEIRTKVGTMLAGACIVKITVKGKGGHGSFPSHVKDCISAACHI